jgi:hypothetical protein
MFSPRFLTTALSQLGHFRAQIIDQRLHGNDAGSEFF